MIQDINKTYNFTLEDIKVPNFQVPTKIPEGWEQIIRDNCNIYQYYIVNTINLLFWLFILWAIFGFLHRKYGHLKYFKIPQRKVMLTFMKNVDKQHFLYKTLDNLNLLYLEIPDNVSFFNILSWIMLKAVIVRVFQLWFNFKFKYGYF